MTEGSITRDYDIGLATTDNIPEILALQDPNVIDRGGGLSVRQSAKWFAATMADMPLVVARRNGAVVGYVLATSMASKAHVPIVQAMLKAFPAPQDCASPTQNAGRVWLVRCSSN